MGIVNILSSQTVDKIAAGEVVANAASVVKEMTENSIDAQSTFITIAVSEGGKKLIKVSDNGTGIFRDDIPKVFLRNATSKIKDDISAISSLGFRGEALASISNVSKINLITRTAQDEMGTACEILSGKIMSERKVACNVGTSIEATDLFYNLPARLKHLSSAARENEEVIDIAGKIALSRNDIAFELIIDKKQIFITPGDGSIRNTASCILGRGTVSGMTEIDFSDEPLQVKGLIASPTFLRDKSSKQITILNGRYIESPQITKAVETVYNELYGKSGADFILYVNLPYNMTDVNIHPAKTNVRFLNETLILMLIKQGLRNSLKESFNLRKPQNLVTKEKAEGIIGESMVFEAAKEYLPDSYINQYQKNKSILPSSISDNSETWMNTAEEKEPPREVTEAIPIDKSIFLKLANMDIIGNAFGLYALIECGNELYAMDTHAAHERVLYDKYLKAFNSHTIVKQELLLPQITELSPKRHALALSNLSLLDEIGFAIEDFGSNCITVRAIPVYLTHKQINILMDEILDQLEDMKNARDMQARNEALIKRACHDAVRGKENISIQEIQSLLRELYETQMPFTCPHGRPILGKVGEKYFMKMFERIK